MATLIHLTKHFNNLNAILQSAERQRQFIENFARDNQLLAEFYANAIRPELAQRGWFIAGSLYPHQYQTLELALKKKAEDQVEEFLKIHIRGQISDVRKHAMNRWKKRAEILADAFDAHIAAKYTLSVPVLLAQADGISYDIFGANLFTNYNGPIDKAIGKSIEKSNLHKRPLAKSFLDLLLEALETSGLRRPTNKRNEMETSSRIYYPLNRHGVLHGLDCDYAIEGNSLRGIALISFLEWVAQVIPMKE